MFKTNKTKVYELAKTLNLEIFQFIQSSDRIDPSYANQLTRASLSVVCNIAEGSGRLTSRDRRNFMVIARGSLFESIAILDLLLDLHLITTEKFEYLLTMATTISKMLYSMIKNLSGKSVESY